MTYLVRKFISEKKNQEHQLVTTPTKKTGVLVPKTVLWLI